MWVGGLVCVYVVYPVWGDGRPLRRSAGFEAVGGAGVLGEWGPLPRGGPSRLVEARHALGPRFSFPRRLPYRENHVLFPRRLPYSGLLCGKNVNRIGA